MNPGERSIGVGRDANGNVLLTGDRNFVLVVQTSRILEPEERVSPSAADFGPNPYKGLAAFREEDADRFFGRERLTKELWKALRDLRDGQGAEPSVRLLAVLGPSGSGKSSLVRAGLLPELARHPLAGLENLRVAVVTPGAHPVDALALVLARLVTGDSAPVAKARELSGELELRNLSGELDGLRRIAGDGSLLVFVDQFEEIYALASVAEREVFIGNLLHAAADRGGIVSVVLTLRTDFLPQSQEDERLHEIITRQSLIVPFLSEEGLRRAIAEPARRARHPLDEGTLELLVQETRGREGALPVLQFTLSRIWEGLAGGVPAAQTYKDLGGVGGSLAKEAQRILESLGESDRAIARRAFLRMVRVGQDIRDTARKVDLDEIVAHGEDHEHVKAVLEQFARPEARIITLAAEPDGTTTTRLTHEALLDRWKRFDEWLTPQAREDLLFHYRLEEEARYWDRRGRPADLLWPRQDLERLRAYGGRSGKYLTMVQQEFFEASTRQMGRGRSYHRTWAFRLYVLFAVSLVMAIGLTVWEARSSRSMTQTTVPPEARDSILLDSAPQEPEELKKQIFRLTGVRSTDMAGSPTVAIVGAPSGGALPAGNTYILATPGAALSKGSGYISLLAYLVQMVAPHSRILFVPPKITSNGESDLQASLDQILAQAKAPEVVLYAHYSPQNARKISLDTLERISSRGSVVVLPAGNTSGNYIDFPDRVHMLVVNSVDPQGKSSSRVDDPTAVWAPGEPIPVPKELAEWAADRGPTIKGTGYAAAIAAGIVARVVDRYPEIEPNLLVKVLHKASQPAFTDGPHILNLDATLAELARNPPPRPTN